MTLWQVVEGEVIGDDVVATHGVVEGDVIGDDVVAGHGVVEGDNLAQDAGQGPSRRQIVEQLQAIKYRVPQSAVPHFLMIKILSLMSNMVLFLNDIFVGVRLSQLCLIYYKTIIEQYKK